MKPLPKSRLMTDLTATNKAGLLPRSPSLLRKPSPSRKARRRLMFRHGACERCVRSGKRPNAVLQETQAQWQRQIAELQAKLPKLRA
jgi:hypothetical protein